MEVFYVYRAQDSAENQQIFIGKMNKENLLYEKRSGISFLDKRKRDEVSSQISLFK